MPRLLPRLIDKISQQAHHQKNFPYYKPPRRPKSLHRPLPPRPSFHPAHHPRSILLDTAPDNPITSSRSYLYHKTLPPRVSIPQNANTRQGETDSPRTMTAEELRWWANPYRAYVSSSSYSISSDWVQSESSPRPCDIVLIQTTISPQVFDTLLIGPKAGN